MIDLGRHGEALHPVEVKVGFAHHHDHIGPQARAGLGLVGSQQLPHFGRGGPFIGEIVVIQRADQAVDGAELPFLLTGRGHRLVGVDLGVKDLIGQAAEGKGQQQPAGQYAAGQPVERQVDPFARPVDPQTMDVKQQQRCGDQQEWAEKQAVARRAFGAPNIGQAEDHRNIFRRDAGAQ